MTRFYPEAVPEFDGEPTAEKFAIRQIGSTHGQGVVALKEFQPGDLVFRFTGFYSSAVTQFSLQVAPGSHLHDPFFMGKILHRCDPNCDVDMAARTFTARRVIAAGDWVTMDYNQTESRLFKPFHCDCGDIPCRVGARGRLISGYEDEGAEVQPARRAAQATSRRRNMRGRTG